MAPRRRTSVEFSRRTCPGDPRVTSAVIGAGSVVQLEENLAALGNLEFSATELAEIDRHATESGINLWAASSEA